MAGNWNDDDKKKIFEAFSVAMAIQNSYGKEIDAKATLKAWEYVMAGEYTADQVCAAIHTHIKQSSAFPTPADLIKIINPPARKITQAEYIAALEYQKNNGYPNFSYEKYLIDDYVRQSQGEPKHEQGAISNELKQRLTKC
jgi:hypothetical protein